MKYEATWRISLKATVEADSEDEAINKVDNLDVQYDGSYIEHSWEFVSLTEVSERRTNEQTTMP